MISVAWFKELESSLKVKGAAMRRTAGLAAIIFCSTIFLTAQEKPRVEVFGGYALARIDDRQGFTQRHIIQNGWNASVAFNINKTVGIVSDFGGYYGTHRTPPQTSFTCPLCPITVPGVPASNKFHTFMFGPQASFRFKSFTPFVHALFGAVHDHANLIQTAPTSLSNTGFAFALGGGLDINMSRRFAFRAQGDYLRFNLSQSFPANHENNLRGSTGLVFSFGN